MPYESSAQYEPLKFSRLHSLPLAVFRFFLFFIWTLFILATQTFFYKMKWRIARTWPMFLEKGYLKILGVDIEVRGKISKNKPCLYVSNHASYIDIMVLGSLIEGAFIAKKEIEKWPVFGHMTKIQRGIFVERKREHAAAQSAEVHARLDEGSNLIMFPEGTSSDGNAVLPFKSSLFALVQDVKDLAIQPVSITYALLDGIPMGRALRPLVTWYGDMTLLPHLWQFLGLGRIKVIVHFNPPLIEELKTLSRKEIAVVCQSAIAWSHEQALHTTVEMKTKQK